MAFETIPGKILARAFQKYGAYIVDDTAWDVYAIETEWSPNGRVLDEFENAWGFPFKEANLNTPWTRDMKKIFMNLHVVDNNAPGNIGGGGKPLVPLAPPFGTTSIEKLPEDAFQIFPNPTKDLLQIEAKDAHQSFAGKIFDLRGKLLKVFSVRNGTQQLNITDLAPGIYFIHLSNEKGEISSQKIVRN